MPLSAGAQASNGSELDEDVKDFVDSCVKQRGFAAWKSILSENGFALMEVGSGQEAWTRRTTGVILKELDTGPMCLFNIRTFELERIEPLLLAELREAFGSNVTDRSIDNENKTWNLVTSNGGREIIFRPTQLQNGPSVAFLVAF